MTSLNKFKARLSNAPKRGNTRSAREQIANLNAALTVAYDTTRQRTEHLREVEETLRKVVEAYGLESPWDVASILGKLHGAACILLDEHSYDGHGHEEIRYAVTAAETMIRKVEALAAAQSSPQLCGDGSPVDPSAPYPAGECE